MSDVFRSTWLPRGRPTVVAGRVWLTLAAVGLTAFVLHVGFDFGGRRLDQVASAWIYDGLELLAVVAVLARALLVRAERVAWLLLAAGLASWTLGDISWTVVYDEAPPFPSLADAFYLGFYPPVYVGLALLVRDRLSRFNPSVWLDGLMAALAVAALGAAILLEVSLRHNDGGAFSEAVNLSYPLGDIVLVAMVTGVFGLAGWRPGWAWTTIASALALTAIADGVYLYQSAHAAYATGTILDALWPASLLLLAGAAWLAPKRQARLRLEGRALAATPLVCGAIALAVLVDSYLERRNAVGVGLAAATLLTMMGRLTLTFRENARVTEEASTLALTDPLTQLWNRRKLLADLEAVLARRPVTPKVLVLYDLNGFKGYNDTFGHPAGDALLDRLASKLSQSVSPGGTCYRLGGDEFCVLASVDASQAERFLSRTTAALAESGEGFDISTAFGCVFLPDDATGVSEALHVADQRLYAQKYQSLLKSSQAHGVLLQALFEREPHLREHIDDVVKLSELVGRELELDDKTLAELDLAAQLHDIGKLAIPDATLSKPGPLDDDEWVLIHRHTTIGQRILNASPALSQVGLIVRATHEKWDGGGYPDRLSGADIPLAARIIAVCDAYSAMTTERPYRRPLLPQAALAELHRCAGSQFDPQTVAAFQRIHAAASDARPAAA